MDRSRTRNVEKRGLRNRVDMEESWTSHYNEEEREVSTWPCLARLSCLWRFSPPRR